MNIPNKMMHIWIGPKEPPLEWMNTWKEKHPDWDYSVFGNEELKRFPFKCKKLLDHYMKLGQYAGVADIIRYEYLYKYGGFIPPADAICLENTDELWDQPKDFCYTVYEHENWKPSFVSPIYACNPGNEFVGKIIKKLAEMNPLRASNPYKTTGNEFLGYYIIQEQPKIKIFPSHYFIPAHFWDLTKRYSGDDKVYADQQWGSTRKLYK